MRRDAEIEFREGVVVDKPVPQGSGSLVDVGLFKEVQICQKLVPGIRVTVQLDPVARGLFFISISCISLCI